jgi:hypothetical protein
LKVSRDSLPQDPDNNEKYYNNERANFHLECSHFSSITFFNGPQVILA